LVIYLKLNNEHDKMHEKLHSGECQLFDLCQTCIKYFNLFHDANVITIYNNILSSIIFP